MTSVDFYLHVATRDNTRKSYKSAIEHYEVEWGGFLPATADSIARYLATYAGKLAVSTLSQRMAAIAQWHVEQGFPDPTKNPLVKKVLKGIQRLHATPPNQAEPLVLSYIDIIDQWITRELEYQQEPGQRLRLTRDRALILLGFWRGFRSDELSRICIENIKVLEGKGMSLYLSHTKTSDNGQTFNIPALKRLCPVTACQEWLSLSGLTDGPLLRSINRWGQISETSINPVSFIALIRTILIKAAISNPSQFSSHSFRRGFATWATASGWDLKLLMEYVGWKDVRSAMRYIDSADPFIKSSMSLNVTSQLLD